MDTKQEELLKELQNIRQLFAETAPTDHQVQERYAWIICKAINAMHETLGALTCRQLLADFMRLDLPKPSLLYSAALNAAIKVASNFPDFHFIPFLRLWGVQHLRKEDSEQFHSQDGRTFSSLLEKLPRAYLQAQLLRPEERLEGEAADMLSRLCQQYGYKPVTPMLVTRIIETEAKGRKMRFVTLTSADGEEAGCEIHALRPALANAGQHHFVNIGQLYNVVLREKAGEKKSAIVEAMQSLQPISENFPVEVGYVEGRDDSHDHIHVFDHSSRHFVSSGQRLRLQAGQFVQFIPIVPKENPFKSAIILRALPVADGPTQFGLREVRITQVNQEKEYCAWELTDTSSPIVEKGTSEPTFTQGYINLSLFATLQQPVPSVGTILRIIVFLRRGKDKQKRPRVYWAVPAKQA